MKWSWVYTGAAGDECKCDGHSSHNYGNPFPPILPPQYEILATCCNIPQLNIRGRGGLILGGEDNRVPQTDLDMMLAIAYLGSYITLRQTLNPKPFGVEAGQAAIRREHPR